MFDGAATTDDDCPHKIVQYSSVSDAKERQRGKEGVIMGWKGFCKGLVGFKDVGVGAERGLRRLQLGRGLSGGPGGPF